ncbi:MFS transporter [Spongiibacter taiwanensis]|uniref:AmpG family muropeptide MFS transporter n=1 Tax=Spongiibacter taiwanensis TaxID=1748242 RepID=UPI002034C876|nr:MFS transporter [Spongiibacter taiwanensis]USA44227.1 MFS transporter [Spongiibacter taiwanensis]
MPDTAESKLIWWREKPVWIILLLGFSAGVPLLLIFSSLSLWLREAGVSKSEVTYFSWAALGYSFKFVWAPLVDKLPLPVLSRLFGRRRGWLLLAQLAVMASIALMAMTNPQGNLTMMAVAAVMLGFSAATQDVVIDAYRIESADERLQALLSSSYIAGYRVGMIAAGAGALYLAQGFGSTAEVYSYTAWRNTYLCMAGVMLVGLITTLLISEPTARGNNSYPYSAKAYSRFFIAFLLAISAFVLVLLEAPAAPVAFAGVSQHVVAFFYQALVLVVGGVAALVVFSGLLRAGLVDRELLAESYTQPIMDFIRRYGRVALWVLLLIGFYRVSDIVLGVIANVFYQDMGYSKDEIASVTKIFGVLMTIAGSFLGGLLTLKYGVMRMLMAGAVSVSLANLAFMWLAGIEANLSALIVVIAADNLSGGLAVAAFVAWLSSLTNVSFTATQYAVFSSLMTLFPKLLGGYSGVVVETVGYSNFFLLASLLGVPVMVLIAFVARRLK